MKFSLDRIEGDLAVCYDDRQKKYEFPAKSLALPVGALFEATLGENGLPENIVHLVKETETVRMENKRRLDSLFNRKPKSRKEKHQ